METKICSKCNVEKDLSDFGLRKKSKDGRRGVCKQCNNEVYKKYLEKNKEKITLRQKKWKEQNREKTRISVEKWRKNNDEINKKRQKEYYCKNKEKRLENHKKWYDKNREYAIKKTIEWQEKNKERINNLRNLRHKERYDKDVLYKIKINVRNRIKHFLKSKNFNEIKNGTFNIVGVSPETLKEHIEKQFKEGMSWENYGHKGWHIDHIIPLSEAKTEEDVYKLCQYSNLQPLWANENYKKGNKI
jgi:hypothetical protein